MSELRRLIRRAVDESSEYKREQLKKNTGVDPEEVAPHLREPTTDPEDCWGPVPPTGEDSSRGGQDPFTKDYHVIPTPPIRR